MCSLTSLVQCFGRGEYDAEITTDVPKRSRFLVDIPEFEGRGLGAPDRVFNREDAVVGNFDELTDEAQVGRTLRNDGRPALGIPHQELAGDERHPVRNNDRRIQNLLLVGVESRTRRACPLPAPRNRAGC